MTDLKKAINDFPKQFEAGFEIAKDIKIDGDFKNIIFCGMGGSIIPAEILLLFLDVSEDYPQKVQFHIHRDYDLPRWASKDCLAICISWSGNTKETLSSYTEAAQRGLPLLVMTKGGRIMELAQKDGTPLILLPQENIPPRMGVGYMFSALYAVLAGNGFIESGADSVKNLKTLNPEDLNDKARKLAEKILNKTPLIYSSHQWRNLSAFWKIFFNENAKVHAFWNGFPSLVHQELAGFNEADREKFFVLLLKDKDDDVRHLELFEKLNAVLNNLGYGHETVEIEGGGSLEKIINNYLLAALTSMYLAQLRGVDPAEAEIIEKFKKM